MVAPRSGGRGGGRGSGFWRQAACSAHLPLSPSPAPYLQAGLTPPSSHARRIPASFTHSLGKHCLAPGTVLSPGTETKSWLGATLVLAGILFANIYATIGVGLRRIDPAERLRGRPQPARLGGPAARAPHLGPFSPACSWSSSLVSPWLPSFLPSVLPPPVCSAQSPLALYFPRLLQAWLT